ncbi:hypothetical protein C8R43DRAFT_942065 [Mycena crocata]|nr:hypothetical protein C8R43DRAFT_942065 [Mycena crocata]
MFSVALSSSSSPVLPSPAPSSAVAVLQNIKDCILEKFSNFACSFQDAADMMSGAKALPLNAPPDFGAFLEDCCKKNPSSPASFFRKVDNPVAFDTAERKNGEKADVRVDDNAAPAPAIPGLANKKIGTGALEPNTQRKGVPQNGKAEVDVGEPNGQRKGTPSSLVSTQLKDVNDPKANFASLPLAPAVEPNAQRKGVPQNEKAEVDAMKPRSTSRSLLTATARPPPPISEGVDVKDPNARLPITSAQGDSANVDVEDPTSGNRKAASEEVDVKNNTPPTVPSLRLAGGNRKAANSQNGVDVKETNKNDLPIDPAQREGENVELDVNRNDATNRKAIIPAPKKAVGVQDPSVAALPLDLVQGGNKGDSAELDVKENTPPAVTARPAPAHLSSRMSTRS